MHSHSLALSEQSLQCATWGYYRNYPGWVQQTWTVAASFAVLGTVAALVAACASAVSGGLARAVPRACTITGLLFWPISWGTFVSAWTSNREYIGIYAAQYQSIFGGSPSSYSNC